MQGGWPVSQRLGHPAFDGDDSSVQKMKPDVKEHLSYIILAAYIDHLKNLQEIIIKELNSKTSQLSQMSFKQVLKFQ